jgi:predicted TIM-barrel fold metal-dependent hydrolase
LTLMSGDVLELPVPGWDSHVHVFDAQAPVAPGHYTPVHRPLVAIEALAQANGFGHLVLVQPSVYGTDNSVLLQALRSSHGRHRGVVVVDATVSDDALQAMQGLGVRGVRFNLVSPVGNGGDANVATSFHALTPRLRALGWHVQWYAQPRHLPAIAALHAGSVASGVPAVLDHLAGMHATLPSIDPAWRALAELAQQGAWIKLSGWYRLQASAPYHALNSNICQAAALFNRRSVWGSDWPHTAFASDAMPGYPSILEPVTRALPAAQRRHVFEQAPVSLYA